ncbi:MAG: hypothetical protein ACREPA_00735 [Candidatus Dormibacteraceae bacterium]
MAKVTARLRAALELVRHDRWMLAGLEDGRLKVIAESELACPRSRRRRDLPPLGRRCLFERRPVALTTVGDAGADPNATDWDVSWPAILHAPVGRPGGRPVGLLTLACRSDHWYEQEEIGYVVALASSLTFWVSMLCARPVKLDLKELQAALLLSEGVSVAELARGLRIDPGEAQELIGDIMRKLAVRSRSQIEEVLPRAIVAGGVVF